MENVALIAIGSNLGNSVSIVSEAIQRLQAFSEQPIRVSSLWQTTPVDCPIGSPTFVNAAVSLVPLESETPETLLAKLQILEKEFGRRPKLVLNEARPLDLDLVAFGKEIRTSEFLTLPHPRAHQRQFVLKPLSEVAPDYTLPGFAKPIIDLLAGLQTGEVLSRINAKEN